MDCGPYFPIFQHCRPRSRPARTNLPVTELQLLLETSVSHRFFASGSIPETRPRLAGLARAENADVDSKYPADELAGSVLRSYSAERASKQHLLHTMETVTGDCLPSDRPGAMAATLRSDYHNAHEAPEMRSSCVNGVLHGSRSVVESLAPAPLPQRAAGTRRRSAQESRPSAVQAVDILHTAVAVTMPKVVDIHIDAKEAEGCTDFAAAAAGTSAD